LTLGLRAAQKGVARYPLALETLVIKIASEFGSHMAAAASASGGRSLDGVTARRLAAIAFADIVGYSILMSDDEVGTHQRWMVLLANIVRPGAERHRGRIVKSTGDGVLAEFPTALDAMEWARGVQEAVHRGEIAQARPIALRMSVHVGEVMATSDDIYGDGVNIAARLQEYGEPGGIILSEVAYNSVAAPMRRKRVISDISV